MSHSIPPVSTKSVTEEVERETMRNASVRRTPPCENRWRSRTLLPTALLLAIFGLCFAVTEAEDGYSIPADAIRIRTEELAADRLTQHLAGLIGSKSNTSANSLDSGPIKNQFDDEILHEGEGELEEFEERVDPADDYRLPTALARLNALLRAAEERKERLESNAATSRLLSINRGGFFRGCKFHIFLFLPLFCICMIVFH